MVAYIEFIKMFGSYIMKTYSNFMIYKNSADNVALILAKLN